MRDAILASLVIVSLLLPLPAGADQRDVRLGPLFERLTNPVDAVDARAAESEIWRIWLEAGDEEIDALMRKGMAEMGARRLEEAIGTFGRVVERAPNYAEGWNKRATAYYLNDDLPASVRDIQRTLALEPRHFGAISGMGLILIRRRDYTGALKAFKEVLRINPNAEGARSNFEMLEALIREKVI